MNTLLRIAAAAALSLGVAGAASAQAYPRVVGSGENASVEYGDQGAAILGGALVRTTGSGESATTEAVDVQHAQSPGVATVIGQGQNASTVLLRQEPAPTDTALRALRDRQG